MDPIEWNGINCSAAAKGETMQEERHVGREVHCLSNQLKRAMDDSMPPEITHMQGRIIGFLSRNEGSDVFQRDVEEEFNIRRPTATGILQLMEKNGLLRREPVDHDARLKKLVLTPKARALDETILERIRANEARLTQGVTPAELAAFFAVMDKFRKNLEE